MIYDINLPHYYLLQILHGFYVLLLQIPERSKASTHTPNFVKRSSSR